MGKQRVERMTAADVVAAVRRHFGAERDGYGPEWAALDEFTLAPGAGMGRCDLFLVRAWSGRPKGHERIAVEVKVSRSDLLNELKRPHKAEQFSRYAHRFYLACPAGMVHAEDPIPAHWGVFYVDAPSERALAADPHAIGTCREHRAAKRNDDPDLLPETALVEAFRRASRAEARLRTAGNDDPARIPGLEKALASSERAEHRAKESARAARSKFTEILHMVAKSGGWYCRCGKAMTKPSAAAGRGLYGWGNHIDGTETCEPSAGRPIPEYRGASLRPEYDLARLAEQLGITLPEEGLAA
jgi:hypothetical protein